jgi:very-short-patch-repair endonuclease
MRNRARSLRKRQTDAERLLWYRLRSRQLAGYKFRRQQAMGVYIVDFICLESKLIIELDGGQHATQIEYDAKRSSYLNSHGFKVLRFWNNDVLQDIDAVLEFIRLELIKSPLPSGEGQGEGDKYLQ